METDKLNKLVDQIFDEVSDYQSYDLDMSCILVNPKYYKGLKESEYKGKAYLEQFFVQSSYVNPFEVILKKGYRAIFSFDKEKIEELRLDNWKLQDKNRELEAKLKELSRLACINPCISSNENNFVDYHYIGVSIVK